MLIDSSFTLITELKNLLITTHDEFDRADPSSMQDACHMNSVKDVRARTPGGHAEFIKIRPVFHSPYLWNEAADSQFLFHFCKK